MRERSCSRCEWMLVRLAVPLLNYCQTKSCRRSLPDGFASRFPIRLAPRVETKRCHRYRTSGPPAKADPAADRCCNRCRYPAIVDSRCLDRQDLGIPGLRASWPRAKVGQAKKTSEALISGKVFCDSCQHPLTRERESGAPAGRINASHTVEHRDGGKVAIPGPAQKSTRTITKLHRIWSSGQARGSSSYPTLASCGL